MATILEALQNANYNLNTTLPFAIHIGKDQLKNAVTLLGKGYDLYDDVESIIGDLDSVDDVPRKDTP